MPLQVSINVGDKRAFEGHEINSAPGNLVPNSFDPADQNVFVSAVHDRRREAAMVQAIRGDEKGVFDFRHRFGNAQA
ncbi:hypothetical protein [Novosphingobium resinovorum]|uniref:hypothetical protein n=1 Tax=Novosphingobium resinovorum TaxID=158500 RepID=UPI002ED6A9AD